MEDRLVHTFEHPGQSIGTEFADDLLDRLLVLLFLLGAEVRVAVEAGRDAGGIAGVRKNAPGGGGWL